MAKGRLIKKEWVEANRDLVRKLASFGNTDTDIGIVLDCHESMVAKYFRRELDVGRQSLRTQLRRTQIKRAVDEMCPKMLIWLGKMYLGQREPKHEIAHTADVVIEAVNYGDALSGCSDEKEETWEADED